jgi:alkanesulfonate monooxygenase SsuD/methylene tetrahydromethanopterin reductase-like flavin-dependent oxidoreductase (luciferase family)
LGYNAIWLGEHHFSRHGIYPNTLTLGASIAAQTTNLRIGTAVIVLPLHHPIRVAEEVALVDILSGGRVNVGIGSGYQRAEFSGLGLDINEARERFTESLEILIEAWTSDQFSYQGKFHSWDPGQIQIVPKPLQRPHPPIYVAVSATPETIDYAAKRGLSVLIGGPVDVMGIAYQVIERWQRVMRESGHDPSGMAIPCSKGIYVARTDEEALADINAADKYWDIDILEQIGSPISKGGEIPPGYEHWQDKKMNREEAANRRTTGTASLIGSPETVAKRIAQLREMGITSLFGQFGMPGMPHAKIRRAIELFGTEVIPQFADDVKPPLMPSAS